MTSIHRAAALVIVILLVAAATLVAQDWRLLQRYLTTPGDPADPANALWFEPKVAIGSGAGGELPVAGEDQRTLGANALEASWAYAQATGTDALIVAHEGVIQLERYAPGVEPSTVFQSQFVSQINDDLTSVDSYNKAGGTYTLIATAKDDKLTVMTLTPQSITY